MEEIEVKDAPLGIKVYVNGKPDTDNMTDEEYDIFISSLAQRMNEYFEKRKVRRDIVFCRDGEDGYMSAREFIAQEEAKKQIDS